MLAALSCVRVVCGCLSVALISRAANASVAAGVVDLQRSPSYHPRRCQFTGVTVEPCGSGVCGWEGDLEEGMFLGYTAMTV